ncbi:MAG: RraA family protein [Bacteroidetes bacterium]|nr:RraA family protein [Bacteroidota bacterium]MDA1121620.1 RraA family protein [Bacteroidota bacterium]
MSAKHLTKEELTELARYDTPTVCNVIELFNFRPRTEGYMDQRIKACFPEIPPIVGYASTATFRCSTPRGKESYSSLEQQALSFQELPGPPIIVFEDLDDPVVGATFGEIMCTSYQTFGAQGLITSGAGRDMLQIQAMGFPVFTNGINCSHGYSQIPSINIPVTVGGLPVSPGDLLHADCNGVTNIPHEIASDVASICGEFIGAENIILDYLNGKNPTPKGLSEAQRESVEVIKRLTERVKR